jgi:CheY-like chemotaxis protein
MTTAPAGRFILRAEIQSSSEIVISYGFELTPSSIFVVTEWRAPIGASVSLRLSFPRVLEPIVVSAKIENIRVAGAPGEFAGLDLSFEACAPIRVLLDELKTPVSLPQAAIPTYRVLLVEDSGLIRDVFAHGLANFFPQPGAFTVDHAESAEVAWDLLGRVAYDLVIVDYFLPVEDGASLIARVRGDVRLSKLPVVAISMGGRDAREATISAGADLFVDKPLVFRDLFSTLRILWERRRPTGDRKTILVLDDSPLALEITRLALESAGFEVVIAEDLSAFERQRGAIDPDLILVDVQMPEAYGDDVAAMLRGRNGSIPIVLLSSIEESELAQRAKAACVAGYICKGAGPTELVRRCKELLEIAA